MSETKDDSDHDLSHEMKRVSFAEPGPSSPLPATNPAAAAAAAAVPSSADKGWPDQEAAGIDYAALTPLSSVVMHRQATINIGTIGHVAHGKCWGRGTKLIKHDGGLINVEDVRHGALLMGDDSQPRVVFGVVRGVGSMFKVTSHNSGRSEWTANSAHVLVLRCNARPWASEQCGRWRICAWTLADGEDAGSKVMRQRLLPDTPDFSDSETAQKYADKLQWQPLEFECTIEDYVKLHDDSAKSALTMFSPDLVTFPAPALRLADVVLHTVGRTPSEAELGLTAWMLGLWLTDGLADRAVIEQVGVDRRRPSCSHTAVIERIDAWHRAMHSGRPARRCMFRSTTTGNDVYRIELGPRFKRLLKAYQLVDNKHFPLALLTETADIRRALLSGVIDGAGSFSGKELRCDISAKERVVIDGLLHLVRALGLSSGAASRKKCTAESGVTYSAWRVSVYGDKSDFLRLFPPLSHQAGPADAEPSCHPRDSCFEVSEAGVAEYFGFQVSGNGRVLLDDFVVSHNSTVVKAISGVQTVRFKTELERNITIKLGYANAKIYRCNNQACPRPSNYKSYGSAMEASPTCDRAGCGGRMILQRHVSFVDCFGVDTEVAMLDGHSRRVDELVEGDVLMGPDGTPRTVLSVVRGRKELYKVSYGTGDGGVEAGAFTCTGGHLLVLRIDTPVDTPVFDSSHGKYVVGVLVGDTCGIRSSSCYFATVQQAQEFYDAADRSPFVSELTVESYLAAPASVRAKARLFRSGPLEFSHYALPELATGTASTEEVAWVLGLWLGCGDAREADFVLPSDAQDVLGRLTAIAYKMGLAAVTRPSGANVLLLLCTPSDTAAATWAYRSRSANPFCSLLSQLGLLGHKDIPSALRLHSRAVREAIIAGFSDSNSSFSDGHFLLGQAQHLQLLDGLLWLLRSCGFSAQVIKAERASDVSHCVRFSGEVSRLPVALSRKRAADVLTTSMDFAVEPLGVGEYAGFTTDGDEQVLLRDFTVGHNCPGHDILMATMLNGAAVMDAAMLLIAGNESCPQPQTSEHLAAVEIMKLKHLLILQNKIDLVKEKEAAAQYDEILNFIRGTVADGSPIIPISAQLKYNVDVICVAAGTAVNLAQGVSVAIEDVLQDDQVLALLAAKDGEEEGLASSRVTAVLDRKMKPCVELRFSDGRRLVCTPEHQIRTATGKWVEAQSLVVGESEVAVGVEYPQVSPREDADSSWTLDLEASLGYTLSMHSRRAQSCAFSRLLGYWQTASSVTGGRAELLPFEHHLDVDAFIADVELLTGERPNVVDDRVDLLSAVLPRRLQLACALVAGDHELLPACMLDKSCPVPVIREFVAALFGGGRELLCSGQDDESSYYWGWIAHKYSAAFSEQLDGLLGRCGVESLGAAIDPASLLSFHRHIGFRYASRKQINLTAAASRLRTLAAAALSSSPVAAPSSPTISRCTTPLSASQSAADSDADEAVAASSPHQPLALHRDARVLPLFSVRLIDCRPAGVRHVYDLTVPHGTSFTAAGVVVHNCEYICKKIPVPVRDFAASPQLIVIRSFDVNKPGEEVDNLKGGVAGGSILKGVLRIGQDIEIRPGIVTKDKTGGVRCLPGDAMVLTSSGWRSIARMRLGDMVMSFNVKTYAQEWKRVTAVMSRDIDPTAAEDTLYRMAGSGMDVICTRDHRMLTARLTTGERVQRRQPLGYETVGELREHCKRRAAVCVGFNRQPAIKVVVPGLERVCDWWWAADEQRRFLHFLGFWLRDGHLDIAGGDVVITQRKLDDSTVRLIDLLHDLFPRCWSCQHRSTDECSSRYDYYIRCPPLCDYLRVMAAGPLGYNPGCDTSVRRYPHFTCDAELAEAEQQSPYYQPVRLSSWSEHDMLVAMTGDALSSHLDELAVTRRLGDLVDLSCDKRWLGDANMATVFSRLSRAQAVALLDGFMRADGACASIQYDKAGEPTGAWIGCSSSFPLIDHLQLIAQLAGASVDLTLQSSAGSKVNKRWQLHLTFTKSARNVPIHMVPVTRPVDVSADIAARGNYRYTDDNKVYCITVDGNANFLTQRLAMTRTDTAGRMAVRARPVFVGNCLPIKSKIVSLYAEHNDLYFAVPGGLIGVGTKIDPTLTRADRLVGQVLGDVGALPDIFTELEISFFLLRRLLGVKTDGEKKKQEKIKKLSKGEILMVNIGSTSTGARILQVKGDLAKVVLTSPVCTSEGEKLALSRRVEKHWRLIGWGKIRKGTRIVQSDSAQPGSAGVAMASVVGGVAGLGMGGDGESVDEMDELSREADQAGQINADEDEDEEEKD